MMANNNIHIVIGVETIRQARSTIMKDLDFWINEFCLTTSFDINKSEFTYTYLPTNSILRLLPCDSASKWFGLSADIFWFNEGNHVDYNIFEQAQMRLPDRTDFCNQIIIDFNPTSPFTWVRELENNPESDTFVSTFRDNPFLGKKQVELIESFKETNWNKWLVYGIGNYGEVRGAILTKWEVCEKFPDNPSKVWYGLDFGYSVDPSALVKVCLYNGEIYVDEMMYETNMTNQDIATRLKELGLKDTDEIIADSSEPKSIEEIRRQGFRISGVKKGKDSVKIGIDILQRYKINITKRSKNIQDEIINYVWKEDRTKGEFTNIPVSGWDHGIDAFRYVALEKLGIKSQGPSIILRVV